MFVFGDNIMSFFPASLENLIDKFASLPGVGRKSAQRLAFHILALSDGEADSFADAITKAKRSVHRCSVCQNLTENEVCSICGSEVFEYGQHRCIHCRQRKGEPYHG